MVLCLLALPIFAIIGIFSIKYRKLTYDAWECLFKTITLRKCESGLDDRIKADLTGRVLKLSPKTGRFFYKNYKIFSWIIFLIFLWSFYVSTFGVYNYYAYGNCNGPESTGFCIFDPTGSNSKVSAVVGELHKEMIYPILEDNDPKIGNPNAELTIIEFGCYKCPYTKKAKPVIKKILDYYEGRVNFEFKTFPIPSHNFSYELALGSECAKEQKKHLAYHEMAFARQGFVEDKKSLFKLADDIGLDINQFETCVEEDRYKAEIEADQKMGIDAKVSGTPTFFINEQKIVGPKPFKTFKKIIDSEIN